MNDYPIRRQKKEADMGFTTRKNNCKIGTKIILPEYKKRIKNFLRHFDKVRFPGNTRCRIGSRAESVETILASLPSFLKGKDMGFPMSTRHKMRISYELAYVF